MPPTRTPLPVVFDAAEPGVSDALFSASFDGVRGNEK